MLAVKNELKFILLRIIFKRMDFTSRVYLIVNADLILPLFTDEGFPLFGVF